MDRPRWISANLLLAFCFYAGTPSAYARADVTGELIIAGNGPELPVMEKLAKAFEKQHVGAAVQFKWDRRLNIPTMVTDGEADFAVTGSAVADLQATQIAWEGSAIVVNFSNPVKEITMGQLANLFGGRIVSWAELDASDANVEIIDRPMDRHLKPGFTDILGIGESIPASAKVIRSDQKVLATVSGRLSAVSYMALRQALEAIHFGTPIRILIVDRIEAQEPTIKDGRYTLRRPVLMLFSKRPNPLKETFLDFVRSPKGQKIIGQQFVPYSP